MNKMLLLCQRRQLEEAQVKTWSEHYICNYQVTNKVSRNGQAHGLLPCGLWFEPPHSTYLAICQIFLSHSYILQGRAGGPSFDPGFTQQLHRIFGKQKRNYQVEQNLVQILIIRLGYRGFLGVFLGEWLWRFQIVWDSLWHVVIRSNYGVHKRNGVTSIMCKEAQVIALGKTYLEVLFLHFLCHLEVGKGERVRFWEDIFTYDTTITPPQLHCG